MASIRTLAPVALVGAAALLATSGANAAPPPAAAPAALPGAANDLTPADLEFGPLGLRFPAVDGARIPTPQEALDTLVADGAVGAVGAVQKGARHGEWSAGKRRIWTGLKAGPHAEFRVASNTKTMVATLVMQMIERGHWRLTDPIDDIAPGLVPGRGDITLEQLLSHRSGMPDGLVVAIGLHMDDPNSWDDFFGALEDDYSDQEIIDAALLTPWLFEPGSNYSYSNAGYVVLGQLLQRHTGKSLSTLMKQRIFTPAGMHNSAFPTRPRAGMTSQSMIGAARTVSRWYSLAHFNPEVFSAAGAATSTARDMVKFADALNSGVLVKRSTLNQMRTPRTFGAVQYGLGMWRLPDPCRPSSYIFGHDGLAFGTLSFAVSSADGTRQAALGVSGRYYAPIPYDINAAALALAAATC